VSVEHFRRRADECRRLASVARNATDKAFWLGLGERWRALEAQKAQQPVRDRARSPLRRQTELSAAD
jgi:adenine-specific DNA glycosylase